MSNESSHPVVVIGAGLGGLAAAVRLRAMGHRVVVVDAGDQPGGRARSFQRDGYSFDAGPTVVTAPYLLHELFELVGRDSRDYFELTPVDPFYRVLFAEGGHFDYVGDEERLLEQIGRLSPADVDGYRKMVAHSQRIFDVGYTQLADKPFTNLSDMLRIMPDMARLSAYRSVYSLVSRYLKDERLRQVFTFQPLLVGGNPFHTPAIYLLIHWLERKWGVHFAMGGTRSIVNGLVRLLEELGVEVQLGTKVSRLAVTNGRVTAVETEDGKRIAASMVVANADPSTVYTKLVDPKDRSRHTDRSVARKRQSMSLFVAYFGTKKTFPDLAHHTIVLGPRYKGLLHDIFERKVLTDDFSLYLHAPTRTDASLAPPGHESFYVLSPVPNQKSGLDWKEEAPRYLDRILNHLDERCLPGLKDNLTTCFSVDPRYFEEQLQSYSGAAFGPEPRLVQSAYFRYHNVSEDVGGLYFVGAGTHPGAGMPGVLSSARVLERVVPRGSEAEARAVCSPRPAYTPTEHAAE
ncbi:MAG: phytoene desaturase [Deltaproteobacteria bacterium]|nr:phytoene desaturase [Deltaproteobacteria bacterium]